MRLYLSADSKQKIGYTPDWLKVQFTENEKDFELVLDIQGSIDYSKDGLYCRVKGELVHWVLRDLDEGDETDLSMMSDEELLSVWPNKTLTEIINNSEYYEIGIYPVNDDEETIELAKEDILTNCQGQIEMYIDEENYFTKDFEFETELNIY